jgi:hypothetical protein
MAVHFNHTHPTLKTILERELGFHVSCQRHEKTAHQRITEEFVPRFPTIYAEHEFKTRTPQMRLVSWAFD